MTLVSTTGGILNDTKSSKCPEARLITPESGNKKAGVSVNCRFQMRMDSLCWSGQLGSGNFRQLCEGRAVMHR